MAPRCLVYTGPTLHRARAIAPVALDDLVILPPATRGDLDRAVRVARTPGVLVVVDGYFHLHALAVGHGELRRAIAAGWDVWGLSSMGAIRAAEMTQLGMRGWGTVFARYRDDPDFRDDEVSLIHDGDPPYRELTEPLVHIRNGLDALVDDGALASAARDAVVADLMGRWFGERTLALTCELIRSHAALDPAVLARWIEGFDRHRIKAHDLLSFLKDKPWTVGTHFGAR